MFKIYLLKEDLNDATSFYLEIIKDSIRKANFYVEVTDSIKEIRKDDIVVCIVPKAFWEIYKKYPTMKILYWFQGIVPEEIDFYNYSYIKKIISKVRYTLLEIMILRKSTINFFVSNSMRNHYKKKYAYNKENFIVMPCFNQTIFKDAFYDEKYNTPTFVYTGSLAKWQCFEQTINLFKKIKEIIPSARLTIYTKEQDKAKYILEKYNVEAEIKYVPYQKISEELRNFKYGFILREDNIVNNVATPTKMSSYLANGIIPIYTDVVGSYKENLTNLKYSIPITTNYDGLEKLYNIERNKINSLDVYNDFSHVFSMYYNRDYYVNLIAEYLKNNFK